MEYLLKALRQNRTKYDVRMGMIFINYLIIYQYYGAQLRGMRWSLDALKISNHGLLSAALIDGILIYSQRMSNLVTYQSLPNLVTYQSLPNLVTYQSLPNLVTYHLSRLSSSLDNLSSWNGDYDFWYLFSLKLVRRELWDSAFVWLKAQAWPWKRRQFDPSILWWKLTNWHGATIAYSLCIIQQSNTTSNIYLTINKWATRFGH